MGRVGEIDCLAQVDELQAVDGLRAGRSEARESDAVTPVPQSMLDAVLPALNEIVRDLVNIQLLTGMRSSESCAFKATHVDTTGPTLEVRGAGRHQQDRPQGENPHRVHRREAQKLLRRYLFGVNYTPASLRAITRTCDKVFPTDLTGDELAKWRREHRFHPHQTRHNFGTMVRAKFGLDTAQACLGHATASVTQIYALASEIKAREVAAAVG